MTKKPVIRKCEAELMEIENQDKATSSTGEATASKAVRSRAERVKRSKGETVPSC